GRRPGGVQLRRERTTERLGMRRMLQHERALQVAAAVQPGGQLEVPLEQGAGTAKDVENVIIIHARGAPPPTRLRSGARRLAILAPAAGASHLRSVSSNRLRIRLYSSAQLVSSVKEWFSTGYGCTDQLSFRS